MTKNQRRLTLTVEEAGALLGVGRSTAYELVRSGEIPCIRLRRRIVVPVARLAVALGVSPEQVMQRVDSDSHLGDHRSTACGATMDQRAASLF